MSPSTKNNVLISILLIAVWILMIVIDKNIVKLRQIINSHKKWIKFVIYLIYAFIIPIVIASMYSLLGSLFVVVSLIAWISLIQLYKSVKIIEKLKGENTILSNKNDALNKSIMDLQNKYTTLQQANQNLTQRNQSLSGYLLSPGQHSIKKNQIKDSDDHKNSAAEVTQASSFKYSWYYIPRGKGYKPKEFEASLVTKLECLQIGDHFYHSYGMLQKYKYTKLSIALVAEKNTITQASTSVFRRKKQKIFWQWKHENGQWKCYNERISHKIQQAQLNQTVTFKLNPNDKFNYVVIKTSNNKGIQRNTETNKKRDIRYPPNDNVLLIDDDMKEYEIYKPSKYFSPCIALTNKDIEQMFYDTLQNKNSTVISVANISNKTMSIHYEWALRTKCIQYKQKRDMVEKFLWHGSSYKSLQCVIKAGFDRSYNSRGVYGKGTYFAKLSGYSVNNGYCVKHSDGYYYILLCRVIVGKYIVGNSKMDKIPKKANGQEFDSLVDRNYNPSIFVSWRDYMSLPIFLIKFKR